MTENIRKPYPTSRFLEEKNCEKEMTFVTNKSFVLAIFVVMLVLIGVAFLQKKQPMNSTQIPLILPTPASTADWEIYRNGKYGFEIKYPKDFYLRDSWGTTTGNFVSIHHEIEKSNGIEINIEVEEGKNGQFREVKVTDIKSFDSYVDDVVRELASASREDERKYYSKQAVTFNDYDARLVQNQRFKELKRIFIYHNQLVFQISAVSFPGYESVIDQILSTFIFPAKYFKANSGNAVSDRLEKARQGKIYSSIHL